MNPIDRQTAIINEIVTNNAGVFEETHRQNTDMRPYSECPALVVKFIRAEIPSLDATLQPNIRGYVYQFHVIDFVANHDSDSAITEQAMQDCEEYVYNLAYKIIGESTTFHILEGSNIDMIRHELNDQEIRFTNCFIFGNC